jgi:hypothetical protein
MENRIQSQDIKIGENLLLHPVFCDRFNYGPILITYLWSYIIICELFMKVLKIKDDMMPV